MKKLLFPLIMLLAISFLVAVESAPSATVGYIARTITAGGYECISLPFEFTDISSDGLDVIDVIGNQMLDEDNILDMDNGGSATFYSPDWDNVLALPLTHTYWVNRNVANPDMTLYLCGKVNPTSLVFTVKGSAEGYYTSFGLNDVREVAITDLDIDLGLLSDEDIILDMQTGESTTYFAPEWDNPSFTIKPTNTYWFYHNGDSFTWTYNPNNNSIARVIPAKVKKINRISANN